MITCARGSTLWNSDQEMYGEPNRRSGLFQQVCLYKSILVPILSLLIRMSFSSGTGRAPFSGAVSCPAFRQKGGGQREPVLHQLFLKGLQLKIISMHALNPLKYYSEKSFITFNMLSKRAMAQMRSRTLDQGGTWVAQLVRHLTLAQVMIRRFTCSSPTTSSVLTAQSLVPASFRFCVSLSLPLPCLHSVSLSLSKLNKHKK